MSAPRGEFREMRPEEDPLDYSLACALAHHDDCDGGCRCWCHDDGDLPPMHSGPILSIAR